MQPFIRVHQLRQSFGTQEVLKGVSFDVGKGELMALIGGSGAGKSVILKHLDGLMDPLDGYVEIDGRRISGAPEKIKKQIRSNIGFMFQQGALFDSLSVGENVAFPLREAGPSCPWEKGVCSHGKPGCPAVPYRWCRGCKYSGSGYWRCAVPVRPATECGSG